MSDYAARFKGEALRSGAAVVRGAGAKGADRLLSALLAAGLLLALSASAVLFLPPALRVTRYELSGNSSMTRDELLSAALIHEREYYFALDASRIEANLEAEPRIARAVATKLFPNGLRIVVVERKPVAAALVSIDGRPTAVCLDSEGVAYAEASPSESASVPVLSGLRFEGFRVGTRLPPAVAEIVASLGAIQAKEPALLSAISEIRLVRPAGGASGSAAAWAPELLLYPMNQRIPVRVGAALDASTLRSIILVLDVLGTRGIAASVQEIDFRTGTVVYRTKEGQPG